MRKLNYRIHNPNPPAAIADYLLKILMDANAGKVQLAIKNAANPSSEAGKASLEEHPA